MIVLDEKLIEYKTDLNASYFYDVLKQVDIRKVYWKNKNYFVVKAKNGDYYIANNMNNSRIGILDNNGDLIEGFEYWDFITDLYLDTLKANGKDWNDLRIDMMKEELKVLRAAK